MPVESNRVAWFGSWHNTGEKIKQINQNAALLKSKGWDVGVVTQYPNAEGIDMNVIDHYIYDNTNVMRFSESRAFRDGFRFLSPSCCESRQSVGEGIEFVDKKVRAPHQFSVMRLYSISMHMSLGYGYSVYSYFESDFYGTESLCDLLNIEAGKITSGDLNFIGFESFTLSGGINACLFLGETKFLTNKFNLDYVSSEDEFYRAYPNETAEDSLKRVSVGNSKALVYPREKALDFLGEYNKDWDTSHVGFSWLDKITPRTISSFTVNAPFLRESDGGYDLYYLFRQEMIISPILFEAELVIKDTSGERTIFSSSQELPYNNYYYWGGIGKIDTKGDKKILVKTRTSCEGVSLEESYEISNDFYELSGYHRLRHVL